MTTTGTAPTSAGDLAAQVLAYAHRNHDRLIAAAAERESAERARRRADADARWRDLALPSCADAHRDRLDSPDKQQLHDRWVDAGRRGNVILFGATGRGKTYLASTLARTALEHGDRVACWRTSKLLRTITGPDADHHLRQRVAAAHVLILDDPAIPPLTPHQAGTLLELIDDRAAGATIVTTNLAVEQIRAAITGPSWSRLGAEALAAQLGGPDRRSSTYGASR